MFRVCVICLVLVACCGQLSSFTDIEFQGKNNNCDLCYFSSCSGKGRTRQPCTTPPSCPQQQITCAVCQTGYTLKGDRCVNLAGFPCGGKAFCGEADIFHINSLPSTFCECSFNSSTFFFPSKLSQMNSNPYNFIDTSDNYAEADVIKYEGQKISTKSGSLYVLSNGHLYTINTIPIQYRLYVQSDVNLGWNTQAMLRVGNSTIVFGSRKSGSTMVRKITSENSAEQAYFEQAYFEQAYFEQVESRQQLSAKQQIEVDGDFYSAKQIDANKAYFVTKSHFNPAVPPSYQDTFGNKKTVDPQKVYIFPGEESFPIALSLFMIDTSNGTLQIHHNVIITQYDHRLHFGKHNLYLGYSRIDETGAYSTYVHKIRISAQRPFTPFADAKLRGNLHECSLHEDGEKLWVVLSNKNESPSSINVFVLNYYLKITTQTIYVLPFHGLKWALFHEKKLFVNTVAEKVGVQNGHLMFGLTSSGKVQMEGCWGLKKQEGQVYPLTSQSIISMKNSWVWQFDTQHKYHPRKINQHFILPEPNFETQNKKVYASHEGILVSQNTQNGVTLLEINQSQPIKADFKRHIVTLSQNNQSYSDENLVERVYILGRLIIAKSKCYLRFDDLDSDFNQTIELAC